MRPSAAIVPTRPSPIAQAGDVHRFLAQAVGREQLEHIVAQQIDRADFAAHRLGDEVDDAVELGLRRAALGHDLVETGQDLAGGGGGGGGHGAGYQMERRPVTHRRRQIANVSKTGRTGRVPMQRFASFAS